LHGFSKAQSDNAVDMTLVSGRATEKLQGQPKLDLDDAIIGGR